LILNICELLAVLLLTAAAFLCARAAAQTERDGPACGGEVMLLLLPVVYYAGKRIILDWLAVPREKGVQQDALREVQRDAQQDIP